MEDVQWQIKRIRIEEDGRIPEIEIGWEPFGVQLASWNTCYIWLRKAISVGS